MTAPSTQARSQRQWRLRWQLFLVGVEDAVQLADAGEAIGGEEAWAELLLSMVGTTPQEFNLSPEVRCDMRRESARFGRPANADDSDARD